MSYVFDIAIRINEVYISDQEDAAFASNFPKRNKAKFTEDLGLAFKAVGIDRALSVIKRENYIKSKHPDCDYIHLWFVGVENDKQGKGKGTKLINEIFSQDKYKNLPVYLKTSNKRNLPLYERLGFKIYHTWKTKDYPIWFMRNRE